MRERFLWRKSILIPVVSKEKISYTPDELENILTASIVLCVKDSIEKNNGEICATLSGGLDSSLCLGLARKIIGSNGVIHTFTTGGSVQHPDIQFARKISNFFGTIHHELIPTEAEKEEAEKEFYSYWGDEHLSLGGLAVFLTYKNISQHGFRFVISHDGIDELLGGYWDHRKYDEEGEKIKVFEKLWATIDKDHLLPLERKASKFGVEVILPYLEKRVVEYISKIPVGERTSRETSKMPLRLIAKKYLPADVIERRKLGFCSSLEKIEQ